MSVGIVSFLDTSDSSKLFKYTVSVYSDLSSLVDVNEGDIAWVQSYSLLTPTRFSGAWQYLGGAWIYGSKELQGQVSTNIAEIQQNEDAIALLQSSKTDKGGYPGTSQDLKDEIDTNTSDVSSKLDKGAFTGDAQDLENSINQESVDRSNADITLQAGISTNASNISQEGSDRSNADNALQLQISNNDSDISTLQSSKLDNGGYAGNGQDLKDEIDSIDGSETKIQNGTNTTVSGTGTTADPYKVNAIGGASQRQHRHIYFATTNTTDTVISSTNTPVKVLGLTTQGFGTSGLIMSGSNRILNDSGVTLRVKVEAVLSLDKEQGGGNDNYTFFINQTGANLVGSKSTSEGRNNDLNTSNPTWVGDMADGQWFEVWVQNIDSSNNLKVSDLSFIVTEL